MEAQSWKEKYEGLRNEKRGRSTGSDGQMLELHESWRPNEIGGGNVYEMGGNVR